MQYFINYINSFLTGPIVVVILTFVGIVISFKTRFVQVRCFKEMITHTCYGIFKKKKDKASVSGWQVATAALSGTIGTGNIVGVAAAIMLGGVGSIFWMWVSAFFGMATKYYEIYKSVQYRKTTKTGENIGGPMYYMDSGLNKPLLSCFFCVFCILASFGIGNMVQTVAVKGAVELVTDRLSGVIPLLLTVIIGFVIIGGIKRITGFTEIITPIMALFYIIGCVTIVLLNINRISEVFYIIISSAFNPEGAIKPAVGGVVGYTFASAIKMGFAKGVFTNEAGLGSAPIVHAASNEKSPHKQGLWGIFEVFFDTIVMCSLTAFVIILSDVDVILATETTLTITAFSVYFGEFTKYFLAVSLLFFAISSMVSWSYYGQTAVLYLSKSRNVVLLYKILFIIITYIGCGLSNAFVWGFSDLFNGLMLIPNIIALLLFTLKKDE